VAHLLSLFFLLVFWLVDLEFTQILQEQGTSQVIVS
jgi:hypothetical protein